MSKVFEARYYNNPAEEVAEVNELKANHAAAKQADLERAALAKRAEQQRIREKILRKVRAR